ncbi:MAG: bile acid:sodium symporter [Verrucomicrobiaceae bacterium]|nr:bile acid:sodium symporter [Verrucomicrobiaceae bacterium]
MLMNFLKKIGIEPFIMALFGAIFFAWLVPDFGRDREPFSLGDAANWGVSVIFFFYGLRLSKEKLVNGLRNVKLHFLVHFSTFVLFPIVVLSAMYLCGGFSAEGNLYYLWIGAFFLATLPSTVSSSVVMVSIAGGNLPAAIFNASISSFIGVFITPLWMGIFLKDIDGSSALADVILKLVFQVLVPVVAGFLLNKKWGWFAEKHKKILRLFDETIIVLIVYTSFCESFYKKMFDGFAMFTLVELSVAMIVLFLATMLVIWGICKVLKFSKEDSITAVFCGSKKSLVHGSVMSRVLFGGSSMTGIILLPTMLYHAFQLIIVSIIAKKISKK